MHYACSYPTKDGKWGKTGTYLQAKPHTGHAHGPEGRQAALLVYGNWGPMRVRLGRKMGYVTSCSSTQLPHGCLPGSGSPSRPWTPAPRSHPESIRKEPRMVAHPLPLGFMCPSMKSTLAFLSLRLILLTCGQSQKHKASTI